MKDLLKLVLQYRSDVETRIACIKNEFENLEHPALSDEETVEDYETQIAHWEATLKQIDEVLEDFESVNLIAGGYEWTCPICNSLNEEIEATETVNCKGCNTTFKTNPPDHCFS